MCKSKIEVFQSKIHKLLFKSLATNVLEPVTVASPVTRHALNDISSITAV